MRIILPLLFSLTTSAAAQTLPRTCTGSDPDWTLSLEGDSALFEFQRQSELTLMLETSAEGADWPRALTYIGRGDSAIVLLEQGLCEDGLAARILTQRGETPLLLTGCCTP